MAVAHETATESHTGTTGSTSEASFDFNVPFTSSSKSLWVGTMVVGATGDLATSVKIDPTGANTDVPAVSGGRAVDTAGEVGDAKLWFLDGGLPTTTTTVRVNRTNNAETMYAVAITVTGSGTLEVTGIILLEEDGTLAEQSVDDGSPGTDSVRYAFGYSGLPTLAGSVVGANSTLLHDLDVGPRAAGAVRETTAGQGARSVGWTSATNDDRAFVHFAIREVSGGAQSLTGTLFTKAPTFSSGVVTSTYNLAGVLFQNTPSFFTGTVAAAGGTQDLTGTLFQSSPTFNGGTVASTYDLAGTLFSNAPTFFTGTVAVGAVNLAGVLFQNTPSFPQGAVTAAGWADRVIVPPTGSSGLDTGDHTSVDELPPWSDSDEAVETITSATTEVAIFTGFDLSLAGGEKKGFQIWARMRTAGSTFAVTITLKQDTTTLWTSTAFNVTNTAFRTFVIPVPDASFVGSDIDNLSLEFSCENLGSNSTIRWSWLRMSKSPFTTAQEAILPPTLSGQEFVCYRASDIGVLGGADAEALILLPDASGKGRHSVLVAGSATYETDAPEGILGAGPGRFVGTLGFDSVTGAEILWSDNKIFHAQVYPSTDTGNGAVFSAANASDFLGTVIPGRKHLLSSSGGWVLMSGDGSAEAHLSGGTVPINTLIRITQWIQISGGNEHMWENDDATPIVDGSSGDNPFNTWSILDRESDDRPFLGRVQEVWFIEGTGVTEAEIDDARDVWVNGLTLDGALFTKAPTFPQGAITANYDLDGTLFVNAPTFFQGAVAATYSLTGVLFQNTPVFNAGVLTQEGGPQPLGGVLFQKAPTFPQGTVSAGAVNLDGVLFQQAPSFFQGAIAATYDLAGQLFQNTPVFSQGELVQEQILAGVLFQSAPVFPQGSIGNAGSLEGVLFQKAPTFFVGAMGQVGGSFWRVNPAGYSLNPAAYTLNPAAYDPVLRNEVPPWPIEVHGELFEKAPTFLVGALS